jgi:hypothetical protein
VPVVVSGLPGADSKSAESKASKAALSGLSRRHPSGGTPAARAGTEA